MKLIKEIRDNAAILTLRGEFDSFVCSAFMKQVNSLLENNIKYILLDMRLVLFINSTALGTLVKTHKETKKKDGLMVICRPSNFVRDVLDSLAFTDYFKMADDPETALKELGASSDGMDIRGDSSVIIHLTEKKGERCIGKVAALEENDITILIPEPNDALAMGVNCHIKFRIPLFKKGHYFEADVNIYKATPVDNGMKIKCNFQDINSEDKKSIKQFVEEMKFLKEEASK